MECNKDEAMRAKEIAEKKFDMKDFEGAKKFALKAQNLYPRLEGLSQMLTTFDVYVCASSKRNGEADWYTGEADWYSILGIDPSADDETVKKHYRKLALMLHPDKNKSIGADGAFQIISEALSVLSDKSRRALYDQKRSSIVFPQKKPPPSQVQKAPAAANGFYGFANSNVSSGRENKNTSRADNSSASGTAQEGKPDTFWTVCHKCKMQFEYPRVFCNYHLLCQNCRDSFLALETPAPDAYGVKTPFPWNSIHQQQNSDFNYASKTNTSNGFGDPNSATIFRWTPLLQCGASNVAHPASAAQQTYENAVREFEEALAAEKQDKDMKRKYDASQKMCAASSTNHINFAQKRRDVKEACGIRDLSRIEICNILADRARTVIHKKISTHESNSMPDGAISIDKVGEKAYSKDKGMRSSDVINPKKSQTSVGREAVDSCQY